MAEYKYKNTFDMSEEDFEIFKEDPHKWFLKELEEALNYDPLLSQCYKVFKNLYQINAPFQTLEFLTMALYQALLSNSINQQQLTKAINNSARPIVLHMEEGNAKPK